MFLAKYEERQPEWPRWYLVEDEPISYAIDGFVYGWYSYVVLPQTVKSHSALLFAGDPSIAPHSALLSSGYRIR